MPIDPKSFIASEEQEQMAFIEWLELKKLPYYHIPNGGYRNQIEAAKFKRLGVQSGVPDLCIPLPNKTCHGLYIEMKRKKNALVSPTQKNWIAFLNTNAYLAQIAYGCEHAIQITQRYFEN